MIWFDLAIASTISLRISHSQCGPGCGRLLSPLLKGIAQFQLESQRNLLLAETRRQRCILELFFAKKNESYLLLVRR
jgi:hypothetical protein